MLRKIAKGAAVMVMAAALFIAFTVVIAGVIFALDILASQ